MNRRDRRDWSSRELFGISIFAIAVIALWPHAVVTIPSGHVGVLWLRFFGGTVYHFTYHDGTKVIFPWDKVYVYDARLQRIDQNYETLTADGLKVKMEVSATFFINRDRVSRLHSQFGENYRNTLISPIVASQVDLLAANRPASEMYSMARADMVREILVNVSRKIAEATREFSNTTPPVIDLVDLNIHDIELPPAVQSAIEDKLNAEQDVTRQKFRVESGRAESELRIEQAEGTRRVQEIINPGLTGPFLRWQANDALTRLAEQPNNKTIVLGPGVGLGSVILDGSSGGTSMQPDKGRQVH